MTPGTRAMEGYTAHGGWAQRRSLYGTRRQRCITVRLDPDSLGFEKDVFRGAAGRAT